MREVLRAHPRAIVHLRQQYKNSRLGLVFGAGISKELSFPGWDQLVESIAKHPTIKGGDIYDEAKGKGRATSVTQLLFQDYKLRRMRELVGRGNPITFCEKMVLAEWREAVHESLYKDALQDRRGKLDAHPYLKEFISILNNCEFTVNYNFDDTIEFMLSQKDWNPPKHSLKGKAYQAVWNPHMQFREDATVIYHPNGFLPGDRTLQQSESLVFSEDSFSDQLIDSMSGRLSSLLHLFTKKTCLFVGASLEDNTLKHLLRQASVICPGNYHYLVKFVRDKSALSNKQKKAIFESNFEVYNLITLFLDNSEIASLAGLIKMNETAFRDMAAIEGVGIKFNYYVVGVVGSGKSTVISHFGSLKIFEEWVDERPEIMSKPFKNLSDDERSKVDGWVNDQFSKKNVDLKNQSEGIHLIDRSPLDPISFSQRIEDMRSRAVSMTAALAPGASGWGAMEGRIIYLNAMIPELRSRLLAKQKKEWDEVVLKDLEVKTERVYAGVEKTVVDNISRPISDVVKSVARVVFVDEYEPANLQERICEIAKGEV